MFEFNWKYFSNQPHIKKLHMNEQKKLYKAELIKRQKLETFSQLKRNLRL
jgi:hypothetical protein